jgi:hypothetical protein
VNLWEGNTTHPVDDRHVAPGRPTLAHVGQCQGRLAPGNGASCACRILTYV